MFNLKQYHKKEKLPKADYILEDLKELNKVLENLTPRLVGIWEILLIQPSIKDTKAIIEEKMIPKWVNATAYLGQKNLEVVCISHPDYIPKQISFKEQANSIIADMTHLIDKKAASILIRAFWGNVADLQTTLQVLDNEAEGIITVKDVEKKINYTKPVYASEVLKSFLLHEKQRWNLYYKLLLELGDSYAYNALYKSAKTLLQEKNKLLNNEDVKQFIVKRIDAPFICYVYSLFAMSTTYQQLFGIMHAIDNRSAKYLERTDYDYLQ